MMHSIKSEAKLKLSTLSFEAIGTHWSIEHDGDTADIEQPVLDRIELFDKAYSRFREDSIIAQMAQAAGIYELPDDAARLFDFYDELYVATSGLVTPLVGSTLSDAGYDANYSLSFARKTIAPDLSSVLERADNVLTILSPVLIDVGAAGKGYLVDIVAELIIGKGITNFIINAGGDILVSSAIGDITQIALEHPRDASQAIGIASVKSGSICGSSIHLRAWGSHHHIINPNTGDSPMGIQAVWVYAKNALMADGISTALFFEDPDSLRQKFNFEYAIMKADDSLHYSTHFPATFFD